MARVRNPPRHQRRKKDNISAKHLDILRPLAKGSRGATHVAAKPTTPAATMDIPTTVNQPPRYQRHKKDKVSAKHLDILRSRVKHSREANHVAGKSTTPTTTTVNEPNTIEVSDLAKSERAGVPNGANGRKEKTLGPAGESAPDTTAASAHPSKKEQAKTPKNGASGSEEPSATPQTLTDGSGMFGTSGRLITLSALVVSLLAIIEFARVHYTEDFHELPHLNHNDFWYRMLVRFSIGFAVVRYRRHMERYTHHIRLALLGYCMYGLVREGLRL